MNLTKLTLRNFRNIQDETVEFIPQINVFVGDNGQGKTNLLESIYFCSRGRSFRTSKTEHLISKDSSNAFVSLDINYQGLLNKIEITISERQKSLSLNGKKTSFPMISRKVPTVLFSPESLQSIKEGPEERRKLADELVLSMNPENATVLSEFDRAYKTKNRILKDHRVGVISLQQTQELLESLIPTYVAKAAELTTLRLLAFKDLLEGLKNTFKSIINDNSVDIFVDYVVSDQKVSGWDEKQVLNAIYQRQRELLPSELQTGANLVGPHKHEIRFLYNGNDSRFFCSQGQQRAIVLSLKISQVLRHKQVHNLSPVLLLDDVLSELDSDRRDYLVRFLKECSAQTIVTTTDLAFCEELRSEKMAEFHVKSGRVVST